MSHSLFDVNLEHYHYLVNGKKFSSKLQALEHAQGDPTKVHWYFMDHVWDSCNWTVEPTENINELLRMRCVQLRQKYDYLALWYSSGYDSHTMLTSFVRNGIPIDEIVIMDRRHLFPEKENDTAIANARYVKDHFFPNLKINVVRVNEKENLEFYRRYRDQWIYYPGEHGQMSKWSSWLRGHEQYHLQNTTSAQRRNRADIYGLEKPRVLLSDNKWYAFLPDSAAQEFMTHCEKFYYSEDLPELQIKQCWLAIKWFEQHHKLTEDFVHVMQGKPSTTNDFEEYYRDYNIGFGRVDLINDGWQHAAMSLHGGQKRFTRGQFDDVPQSAKLLEYAKINDPEVYNIYMNGVQEMKRLKEELNSTVLLSKQWYIKDLAPSPGLEPGIQV
jgi:hypothetical protein